MGKGKAISWRSCNRKMGKLRKWGTHVEIPADFPKERVLNAAGGYITPGFLTFTDTETGRPLETGMMSF